MVRGIHSLPADLVITISIAIVALIATVIPGLWMTPFRFICGIPLVLFLPGYAFVAALFPKASQSPDSDAKPPNSWLQSQETGITLSTRIILSFGLSVVLSPLVALILTLTPWGISLISIVLGLTSITIVCSAFAIIYRQSVPPKRRFSVPYRDWLETARGADRQRQAVVGALVLCLVCATAGVGYTVITVGESEQYTAFYLLSDDGESTAEDYPTMFRSGEEQSLQVGVENAEQEPMTYTIVIELHRVEERDGRIQILDREALDQFQMMVEHGETETHAHTITPTMTGDDLRLTYLLYKGEPPAEPTPENAYRHTHLSITVTDPEPTETNQTINRLAD